MNKIAVPWRLLSESAGVWKTLGEKSAGEKTVKKSVSVKENYEFRRIYAKGRSGVSPYLVVYFRPNRRDHNRLGVTVSTKLGHAVVRNRVKRRIREIFRLNQDKMAQGYDVIVVARSRSVRAKYSEMDHAFLRVCGKIGLLEKSE